MDMKEFLYAGYCNVCQRFLFYFFKRRLGYRELSKWRRCYRCGEIGVFGLQLTDIKGDGE
jgi:hypothetical protein